MRVVVTGREGQVAQSLAERGPQAGADIVRLGRPQLDLAGDPAPIITALKNAAPDVIVSAAAYTAVDKAETEPELALATNERGARAVAQAADELGVPLIHLSTDYVFDGTKPSPYVEDDETGPTGVYGQTKLAGERAVASATGNVAILRTAWVYSPFGANFVKTMLRLASSRDEIGVVMDQFGNPTSALDIGHGVLAIARNLVRDDSRELRGLFHMAGQGDTHWAEFAEAVFSASAANGGPLARVRHITTSEFPTLTQRPANSRLDGSKLARAHGVRLPSWRSSLPDVVRRLVEPAESSGE